MDGLEAVDDPIGSYPYRDWEDLYRDEWDWDSVARSTHSVNCTGSCSWNVYVKNGQVWREEQAGDYPRFDESLPDPNPRGCQKGACYTDYVNADERIKHPLKRVGERGEGKWRRISWDEALTEIAEHVVDEVQDGRYDAISGFTPIPAMSPVSFASGSRLINLLGGVSHSFYDWYSDLPPGQPITWGTQTDNAESADWYNADYIIAWGSNINVTRIPDAKYFLDAGYEGEAGRHLHRLLADGHPHRRVAPPDGGSDTALALGMAQTIVDEGLHDEAHLKEQTDMPLLVREDTGKFLRASEVGLAEDADDPEKVFVMVDADGTLRRAPGSLGERDGQKDYSASIELDFDPQLSVERSVDTDEGSVAVRSVWVNLTDELASNAGRRPRRDRRRREHVPARRPRVRRGRQGEDNPGQGRQRLVPQRPREPRAPVARHADGQPRRAGDRPRPLRRPREDMDVPRLEDAVVPDGQRPRGADDAVDLLPRGHPRQHRRRHGREDTGVHRRGVDAGLPRRTRRRLSSRPDDDVRLARQLLQPGEGERRRRRGAMAETRPRRRHQLPDGLHGDVLGHRAAGREPLRETRPLGDGHAQLRAPVHAGRRTARRGQDRLGDIPPARREDSGASPTERGVGPIEDRKFDRDIDLQSVYDDYVRDWETGEADALAEDRAACEYILEHSEESNPSESDDQITFADTVEQPQRLLAAGDHWTSDIEDGAAYTPWKDFVQDKNPWPTVTGRQQYYIDHDWFLELGEQLPTHKEGPTQTGGDYPMEYNTPHGRWSIHSTWRDDTKLLRLQRGEPVVYLNPEDAQQRGRRR